MHHYTHPDFVASRAVLVASPSGQLASVRVCDALLALWLSRYRQTVISLLFDFLDIGLPNRWSCVFHVRFADLTQAPCRRFPPSVLYSLISFVFPSIPFFSWYYT